MLKRIYQKQIVGFSLTELMIALVISSIIMVALLTVIIANLSHYQQSLNMNRLNQQLAAALSVMSDDIRRAGYWSNANSDLGTGQNNNPFVATGNDLTINGATNCILFTYDHDSNGTLSALTATIDDERYGFRLSNGAIQSRPPGASFDCLAGSSAWENITDTNIITITNLAFALSATTITTGPGTKGIQLRSVDISITGQLKNDATVSKTLTQHVRIRNDKFIP